MVLQPSGEFKSVSDSIRTAEDIVQCCNDYYSVLTHKDVHSFVLSTKRLYPIFLDNDIDFLTSKIVLNNFPIDSTYYLQAHGANLTTARPVDGKLTFTLFTQNKNSMLYLLNVGSHSDRENKIPNPEEYLDINRVERLDILSTKPLDREYTIELYGKIYQNGQWKQDCIEYTIYPKKMCFSPCGPVRNLMIDSKPGLEFLLNICGKQYGPFKSNSGYIDFGFENFGEGFYGKQNKALSENQNKKTLNFSRIQNPSLSILNDHDLNDIKITCLVYQTYYYETCTLVYT